MNIYYLFHSEESRTYVKLSHSIAELKLYAKRNYDSFVIRHGAGLHTSNNAYLQPIVYSFNKKGV